MLTGCAGSPPPHGDGPSSSNAMVGKAHVIRQHGDLGLIATNALDKSLTISAIAGHRWSELYGIGMPDGLDQEVLVDGGTIHTGGFADLVYTAEQPGDLAVDFLAYAFVGRWRTIRVPAQVRSFSELETFVAGQVPTNTDAVFRLDAEVAHLRWFVVGGMGNGQPDHRSSFARSRILGGFDRRRISAVGFLLPNRLGSATSPSAPMHVHFRTTDAGDLFVGHLDGELALLPGATLYVADE